MELYPSRKLQTGESIWNRMNGYFSRSKWTKLTIFFGTMHLQFLWRWNFSDHSDMNQADNVNNGVCCAIEVKIILNNEIKKWTTYNVHDEVFF